MKKSLLLLLFATPALAGPPVLWGPDNKILGLEAGLYLPQSGTPTGSPLSGYDYIYIKSDDNLYIKNSSGIETQVGGSSSAVTTMGAFGSTPNANGGSIATSTLTLQPADATHPGGVSTTTQAFAGPWTLSNALAVTGGSTASGGAITLKALGTGITQGLNMVSSDGVLTWSLLGRNTSGGQFFIYDGSNIQLLLQGSFTGIGPSAPLFHLDVNRADPNTTLTAPGVTTVMAIHNTDTTTNNFESVLFVNSGGVATAAIEGVNVVNTATFTGKLEFLTGKAAALGVRLEITQDGQINHKGTVPTIASAACGTLLTGTVVGNDVTGRITVGTGGANPCTLTFNATWTNAPICQVVDETAALLLKVTPSTGSLVITGAMSAGDNIGYHCTGYL